MMVFFTRLLLLTLIYDCWKKSYNKLLAHCSTYCFDRACFLTFDEIYKIKIYSQIEKLYKKNKNKILRLNKGGFMN